MIADVLASSETRPFAFGQYLPGNGRAFSDVESGPFPLGLFQKITLVGDQIAIGCCGRTETISRFVVALREAVASRGNYIPRLRSLRACLNTAEHEARIFSDPTFGYVFITANRNQASIGRGGNAPEPSEEKGYGLVSSVGSGASFLIHQASKVEWEKPADTADLEFSRTLSLISRLWAYDLLGEVSTSSGFGGGYTWVYRDKSGFRFAANYLIALAVVGPNFGLVNGRFLRVFADSNGNYCFKVLDCGDIKLTGDGCLAERVNVRANLVRNPFSTNEPSEQLVEECQEYEDLSRFNAPHQLLLVIGGNSKHGEFSEAHYSAHRPFVEFEKKSLKITPLAVEKMRTTWKFAYS